MPAACSSGESYAMPAKFDLHNAFWREAKFRPAAIRKLCIRSICVRLAAPQGIALLRLTLTLAFMKCSHAERTADLGPLLVTFGHDMS